MMKGTKFDAGKLRFDLVDDNAEAEFVAVLSFGAIKYEPENWRDVPDPYARYYAALRRHLREFRKGNFLDPETGLHHLAHAVCCVHFMLGIACERDPSLVSSFEKRLLLSLAKATAIRAKRKL